MKPLVIDDEAADELEEAIEYYEKKRRGLGVDLAAKVSDAFLRIQQSPGIYPYHKQTRIQKCLVRRFPYLSFTLSLTITSQSLQLHTRSGGLITGNSENLHEIEPVV